MSVCNQRFFFDTLTDFYNALSFFSPKCNLWSELQTLLLQINMAYQPVNKTHFSLPFSHWLFPQFPVDKLLMKKSMWSCCFNFVDKLTKCHNCQSHNLLTCSHALFFQSKLPWKTQQIHHCSTRFTEPAFCPGSLETAVCGDLKDYVMDNNAHF